MQMGSFWHFLVLLATPHGTVCHKMLSGRCPSVPPARNFDAVKFEGLWFVASLFEKDVSCMTWEIKKINGTDNQWSITESRGSGFLTALGVEKTYGKLTHNSAKPGEYSVKWNLNAASYPWVVYYTDYENVAGVFACQNVVFFQRQQGAILSRVPLIEPQYRQLAIGNIVKHNIEIAYFEKVNQSHCWKNTSEESLLILVDGQTGDF